MRLKAAIATVKPEDLDNLRAAKERMEELVAQQHKEIDANKWQLVQSIMEEFGAEKYPAATLEKAWKKLGTSTTAELEDPAK